MTRRLSLDCAKTGQAIVDFIREKLAEQNKNGILLGLSGGIDSATVAALAARATAPANVYALCLPDRTSRKRFREYAGRVADKLGIHFELRDISAEVEKNAAYRFLI
ncbi:MAG: asparagine synthase-related protein, partial [Candidatus Omnitrophota bacterium]